MAGQLQAVGPSICGVCIREVPPDVSQSCAAQYGVHHSMGQHICIRVAVQTFFKGDLHAAQDELAPLYQAVNIVSMTDPHFALSLCFRAGQILPGRDLDIGVISLGQLHRATGQLKQTAIIRDEPCLFRVQRGQRLQVRRTLKALRRLHCIQGAAIRRSLYHAVRGHDASIPGQRLLDRILDRHCRGRCSLLCSGQQHCLDHSLADKWAGCVMDSHQLAVCCQHPVFGAFCPGGSTVHHLYRLAAQAGLLLQLCAVFARHRISSLTSGQLSKARMLRRSTVSPPRSARSLSNPIRVEEPAATRTADTLFFILSPCFAQSPALSRPDPNITYTLL